MNICAIKIAGINLRLCSLCSGSQPAYHKNVQNAQETMQVARARKHTHGTFAIARHFRFRFSEHIHFSECSPRLRATLHTNGRERAPRCTIDYKPPQPALHLMQLPSTSASLKSSTTPSALYSAETETLNAYIEFCA